MIFKLKCVGCGKIEKRPAEQCHDQPFCSCGLPMILVEAAANLTVDRAPGFMKRQAKAK